MVYSYKELLQKYSSRYNIKKAIDRKEIYKLDHNIYSNKKILDSLVIYSMKYPSSVITMDSAFYFYNLTDVIPNKVHIATTSNYRTIKDDNVVQIFTDNKKLYEGMDIVNVGDCKIKIYNKERLLVELIRKRNPFYYYKEIISNYREIVNDLDMQKIEKYLSLYKNDINLSEALQREVF